MPGSSRRTHRTLQASSFTWSLPPSDTYACLLLVSFTYRPQDEVLEHRAELFRLVERALAVRNDASRSTEVERERIDFKEEAGRRARDGSVTPGDPHNLAAADQLADEVACMANTPGGGVLVVGVADKTGDLIGAELESEWLRHRIYERVDVAPSIDERYEDGVRLLLLLVAESREPVEGTDGKVRWRVGAHCVPVDRSEWWQRRQERVRLDAMAGPTTRQVADVSPGALVSARRYLGRVSPADVGFDVSAMSDEDMLRALGVLPPSGYLTQAGALMMCPAGRPYISYSVWDAEGGDVVNRGPDLDGLSLLEQIAAVEARLDAVNTSITFRSGFAESGIRRLPERAVREAVLNGLAHRDWNDDEPTRVTWIEADSALEVVSPGGFVGGVTAANLLAEHFARYPALADLLRALGLVDKRGIGVDRMYREMVSLGHRPPSITETPGPRVRARLRGGQPVIPVLRLVSAIEPAVRRKDVKVALVVHTLLHKPYVTSQSMTSVLQRDQTYAGEAIEAAAAARISSKPLVERFKDVWVLSQAAFKVIEAAPEQLARVDDSLLRYRRPSDEATMVAIVRAWLDDHGQISSGDYAQLTGLTVAGGRRQLERLAEKELLSRGESLGRYAHYVAGPALSMRSTPGGGFPA